MVIGKKYGKNGVDGGARTHDPQGHNLVLYLTELHPPYNDVLIIRCLRKKSMIINFQNTQLEAINLIFSVLQRLINLCCALFFIY